MSRWIIGGVVALLFLIGQFLFPQAATSPVLFSTNNLSDLSSASASRTNLGLGTAAVQNVGTFFQVANNLSEGTASTMRTNLGSPQLTQSINKNGIQNTTGQDTCLSFAATGGFTGCANNFAFSVSPFAGTAQNLFIYITSTQPAMCTLTGTLRVNGVDSASVVTIAGGTLTGTTTVDSTHSVSLTAGAILALHMVNGACTGAQIANIGVQIF